MHCVMNARFFPFGVRALISGTDLERTGTESVSKHGSGFVLTHIWCELGRFGTMGNAIDLIERRDSPLALQHY